MGRLWLKAKIAVNYWKISNKKIGPHQHRVSIQVIPNTDDSNKRHSSPEESFDKEYDSWTSDCTTSESGSDSEVDLFALETLCQVVMQSMKHLEDEAAILAKVEDILQLIKFRPSLADKEKDVLQSLVIEFAEISMTRHEDLPSIILKEHAIDLKNEFKLIRKRQRRMVSDKSAFLKAKLDKLLEGGFTTQVKNIEWVSPVVIVPKKKGKWRICVNYKTLNLVTKKDRQPLPFIDELLHEIAGNEIYTFCDGYSGYHQIKI